MPTRLRHPKAIFLIPVLLVLFAAGIAEGATSRLYFAGYLGLDTFRSYKFTETSVPTTGAINLRNSPSFGAALGLHLTDNVRVEAELSYRKPTGSSIGFDSVGPSSTGLGGNLRTVLMMINGYYDIPYKIHGVQPFLGAGIGMADVRGHLLDSSGTVAAQGGTSKGLAWQGGGGLRYTLNSNVSLTGSYRYIGTTDPMIGSYKFSYHTNEFRMGLEYALPVDWLR